MIISEVTRRAINAACVALDTPLVTASAVGFGGQADGASPRPRRVLLTAAAGKR